RGRGGDGGVGGDVAVAEGQAGDAHGRGAAAEVEDARGVVAADAEDVGAGPGDVQVLVEGDLPGGEGDGAGQAGGEVDRAAGGGVGDLLAQGAGAGVVEGGHGGGDAALLQRLQPGAAGGRGVPRGARAGAGGGQAAEQAEHGVLLGARGMS